MRLVIVEENDRIIVQFSTEDIRKLLVANEDIGVGKAFDKVCEQLKAKIARM